MHGADPGRDLGTFATVLAPGNHRPTYLMPASVLRAVESGEAVR